MAAVRLKKMFLVMLSTISINCFSQYKNESGVTNVLRATFFNPGISYETAIGTYQTIRARAFIATSFAFSYSSSFGSHTFISLDPSLSLQYRYYYNYRKRNEKDKRTALNSVNYLAPSFTTSFSKSSISDAYNTEYNRRAIHSIGLVWGMQRNYAKRFSLDLNIGAGYYFTTATVQANPILMNKKHIDKFSTLGELSLGFWLNKRK